jgi:hypothetical protein
MKKPYNLLYLLILFCDLQSCSTKKNINQISTLHTDTTTEWSTQIDNLNTTHIKIVCDESMLETHFKIKAYLNTKRIFLSDVELQNAVVLKFSGSNMIVFKNDIRLEFKFKNNEVILNGDKTNPLDSNENWEPLTPIDSNWSLLSDFSKKLNNSKIFYK